MVQSFITSLVPPSSHTVIERLFIFLSRQIRAVKSVTSVLPPQGWGLAAQVIVFILLSPSEVPASHSSPWLVAAWWWWQ